MTLRAKFTHPERTATGERRARVDLTGLRTLWFNTGTLCNLACRNCYIESSPRNDQLVYLTQSEVRRYLAEALQAYPELEEIGFTGGEPFMNPDILQMIEDALETGLRILVLTNAMRPMQRLSSALDELNRRHPGQLSIRVSLDHYTAAGHEDVRGPRSWEPAFEGLDWLVKSGFDLAIAARLMWGETEGGTRAGFAALFASRELPINATDPARLVLFPEMETDAEVPEITDSCWGILGKSPDDVMCASSRMVVRHKGSDQASVIACTLLPYAEAFDLGPTLAGARGPVRLNHRHCARFCVLGGATCSG